MTRKHFCCSWCYGVRNLPSDHTFWRNELQFTRDVFTNSARELIRELAVSGASVDLKRCVADYQQGDNDGKPKARDMFKRFYKTGDFQRLLASVNPWKSWIESNQVLCNKFLNDFLKTMRNVMKNGHFVDESKLASLNVRLKGA